MKIGEFFLMLGFQVQGKDKADDAARSIDNLDLKSVKLLGTVTALNASFWAMMKRAADVGVVLDKIATLTGLGTNRFQQWEAGAARGNVSANLIAKSIDAIQKARTEIMFGNAEAAAPWMLLGIDPRQDPFVVLEQLRRTIQTLDPAIARNVMGQLGLSEDLLYMFKKGIGPGIAGGLIVTPEESQRLAEMSGQFKSFLFSLSQFATRFGSQFADTITNILKFMEKLVQLATPVLDWMEKGSVAAIALRAAIFGVALALGAVNLALAAFMLNPVVFVVGIFAAAVVGLLAALGLLVFMIQDFWVACRGGKTAFDWNEDLILTVKNVERLAHAIEWVIDKMTQLKNVSKEGLSAWRDIGAAAIGDPSGLLSRYFVDQAAAGGPMSQTNNIGVTVSGGQSPRETGAIVGRAASRQITDAFSQFGPAIR